MNSLTDKQRVYLYEIRDIIDSHNDELDDYIFSFDSSISYREWTTTRETINDIIDAGGYYDRNIEWLNNLREIHNWYKVNIIKKNRR